jgi:hypothetical protein
VKNNGDLNAKKEKRNEKKREKSEGKDGRKERRRENGNGRRREIDEVGVAIGPRAETGREAGIMIGELGAGILVQFKNFLAIWPSILPLI